MGDPSRRRILGLVGIAALSGCLITARQEPTSESESITTGLGAIGRSESRCLAPSEDVYSGWVHTVAHGETYDFTFDVRVAHREGGRVNIDLTERLSGDHVLEFTTDDSSGDDVSDDTDCVSGSRIEGSGRLPLDFETLRVTLNGETLQTLEQSGGFGMMRPLPDPIHS